MKYCLIIGYQLFEKNKEFPTVIVSINGKLIDEFLCDNENSSEIKSGVKEDLNWQGTTYKKTKTQSCTYTFTTPSRCKIYEIDSSLLSDKGSLKIEVVNNNSNYTNGFVNRRSLVMLSPVFLLPKWLIDDEATMSRIIKKSCQVKSSIPGGNMIRLKTSEKEHVNWPGYCNHSDHPKQNYKQDLLVSGGEFDVEFQLRKKHGIYFITKAGIPPIGLFYVDDFFLGFYGWQKNRGFYVYGSDFLDIDTGILSLGESELRNFDDINTSNENQRDNNT